MNDVKRYEVQFIKLLECLKSTNSLDYVMVIGSWAEYLYYKSDMVKGYEPMMKTIDVDFLIPDIRKPQEHTPLVSVLRENGFLYSIDRIDGVSNIVGEDNFEVEFLTPQKGDGIKDRGTKSSIGVIPQQLTHMKMLVDFSTDVEYLSYSIRVPEPEAYLVHKMVINERRQPGKKIKDQVKIKEMLPYTSIDKIQTVVNSLTKKEKKSFDKFIKNILLVPNIEDFSFHTQKSNYDNLGDKNMDGTRSKKDNDIGTYIDEIVKQYSQKVTPKKMSNNHYSSNHDDIER